MDTDVGHGPPFPAMSIDILGPSMSLLSGVHSKRTCSLIDIEGHGVMVRVPVRVRVTRTVQVRASNKAVCDL